MNLNARFGYIQVLYKIFTAELINYNQLGIFLTNRLEINHNNPTKFRC